MPTSNERKMLSSNEALKELRRFCDVLTPEESLKYVLPQPNYLNEYSGKPSIMHCKATSTMLPFDLAWQYNTAIA